MTILFRKVSFYLALLGLLSAALLVVKSTAREPMPPPPVAPPEKPFRKGVGASGLIEARAENTSIGVPAAGLVTAVHVKVWDEVKPGQPLFELDKRELEAKLPTEKAQIAVAEATLKRAQDQVERFERLAAADSGALAADELSTRRNDAAVARAQIEAARASVAQTEALIERMIVRAPIAGTILQVNIRLGEYASPATSSTRAPMILGNIRELQVRADVDEQIAPRVRKGARAIGYVKGDTTTPIPMDFVRIEPFVIPKTSLTGGSAERVDTRVLQVIYSFPNNPERPLYVGQQIDLYIEETEGAAKPAK